jgi:hypothetical protein
MPIRRLPTSLAQALLALAQRQSAEVLAVELQKVERVQHGLADGATPVQRVEDRDAIRPAHHGLAEAWCISPPSSQADKSSAALVREVFAPLSHVGDQSAQAIRATA